MGGVAQVGPFHYGHYSHCCTRIPIADSVRPSVLVWPVPDQRYLRIHFTLSGPVLAQLYGEQAICCAGHRSNCRSYRYPVSTNLVFLILLPFYGEPGDIWVHLQWLRDVVLFNRPLNGEILIAGLLVHVWLLLFAMGALLMQVLNGVLYASKTMQWFLDKGDQNPLEAIGIVATALALLANAAFLAVRYTTSG